MLKVLFENGVGIKINKLFPPPKHNTTLKKINSFRNGSENVCAPMFKNYEKGSVGCHVGSFLDKKNHQLDDKRLAIVDFYTGFI